jgi:hypothetical protein
MMRLSISILAALLLCSCASGKTGKIERRIGERIDACKPGDSCTIRISDVTDFSWDKMYAFTHNATQDQIDKALGTPFPDYVEFTRGLVFLKDGKIVYREDTPSNIESLVNREVIFDIPGTEVYKVYTAGDAVFRGWKEKFNNVSEKDVYYRLEQIK